MHPALRIAALLLALLAVLATRPVQAMESRAFLTTDQVRLHYLLDGPRNATRTIVFVPGWTMPAWIFERQIAAFAAAGYRVAALDPRGQGQSDIAPSGYDHIRRGQDIAELISILGGGPVLLVGWSLGVLDTLAYVRTHGDARIAGLVLVDNSVGEDPPPVPFPPRTGPKPPREAAMRGFVRGMFRHPQPEAWLDRLTATALRTPEFVARQLLAYPVARSYWKEAVYSTARPVLYIVRPKFAAQAANLGARHPAAEVVVLDSAAVGHALFVDDPAWFNGALASFMWRRLLWR